MLSVTGGFTLIGLLAGLVVAQPLAGAVAGAVIGGAFVATGAGVRISDEFVREVKAMLTPGTTVLFVMDEWGDRAAALYQLQGVGGRVLRTTVDPQWATQLQAALVNPAPATAL